MKRILLVEDDESLGGTLTERLQKEGYRVVWCSTIEEAKKRIHAEVLDLAVLDIGLPDGTGFDLAKWIKEQKIAVSFLFLTAQSAAETRLQGFELGAEEFIPKPFHLKELLLRVKHVLERHLPRRALKVGDRELDLVAECVVLSSGVREYFQTKDFRTLNFLIEKAPNAVSRDEILDAVWGEDKYPSNRTVDNSVMRIRQLLGDSSGKYIRSVRGVGYQWCVTGDDE